MIIHIWLLAPNFIHSLPKKLHGLETGYRRAKTLFTNYTYISLDNRKPTGSQGDTIEQAKPFLHWGLSH